MTVTQLFRPVLTLIGGLAILLAAMGMIGCSSAQAASSCSSTACETNACSKAKFEQDRQAILGMAGKYDVTFDFEETMALRAGYELTEPYLEHASEMVVVVEDTGDTISMQHLLVVSGKDGKAHVVKHWRHDWQYETAEGYDFLGKNVWEPKTFGEDAIEGAWMQSVYQVDDSPRYWGVAKWEHRDGVSTWSASTNRPLPRREFSKRKDYQVLGAVNTHVVTPTGWMHYQHNHKIDKENAGQPVIALEAGVNTYAKTNETDFSAAEEYWANTEAYWSEVRSAWAAVYDTRETLHLKHKWKGDRMYAHLFDLADDYWGQDDVSTARAKIDEVIDAFRQPQQVASP